LLYPRSIFTLPLLTLIVVLTAGYLLTDDSQGATINVDTDWIVDTSGDIMSDNTYVMKANLTITGSGQISFRRCKLTFMSENPGDYGIVVQPGGYLTLHTSILQSGYLSPSVLAEPWTFHIQDSGRLSLQASTVTDVGVIGGPERERGLAIESDNVMVTGTNFDTCNRGIVVMGGAAPQIIDNTFRDNIAGIEVKGSSFSLTQDNTFKENVYGILFQEVASAFLGAGGFVDNGDSIRAVTSNVMVENVTISGLGNAIRADINSFVTVQNSSVMVLHDRAVANLNSNIAFIDCEIVGYIGFTKTDSNSHITVKHSVNFLVKYAGVDVPMEEADVEIIDNSGRKVYQQVTGADGLSPVRLVMEYEHHRGSEEKIYFPFSALISAGYNYEEVKDLVLSPNLVIVIAFVDDAPPDLTVQLPIEGAAFQTTDVQVKGMVSDLNSGISLFYYTINGGANNSLPIANPWTATVRLPEGEVVLAFVAVDLLGNEAVVTRRVTIDITPPDVSAMDPQPGSLTRAFNLLVNGTTEPGTLLVVQGTDWDVDPGGNFTGYITLGDNEGEQTVPLHLTDPAGNEGVYDYTIVIDRSPPILTVETNPDHRDFPFINSSEIVVFGDSEPGATVKVHINGLLANETVTDALGKWSTTVLLSLGENALLIDAWDMAGNRRSVEIIDFFYDVTPPEITLLEPLDGTEYKNKVTSIYVEVRTEPDATVWVNDEVPQIQPAHGEVEFLEVDLSFVGNNTITIYVQDRAGNLATKSIVVVRDEKKPDNGGETDGFPVWLVVMALAIVVVAVIVVQRFVLKAK
jgi:parallel beta-helix repeat protein